MSANALKLVFTVCTKYLVPFPKYLYLLIVWYNRVADRSVNTNVDMNITAVNLGR